MQWLDHSSTIFALAETEADTAAVDTAAETAAAVDTAAAAVDTAAAAGLVVLDVTSANLKKSHPLHAHHSHSKLCRRIILYCSWCKVPFSSTNPIFRLFKIYCAETSYL